MGTGLHEGLSLSGSDKAGRTKSEDVPVALELPGLSPEIFAMAAAALRAPYAT